MTHTYMGRDVKLGVVTFGDLVASQEAAETAGKNVTGMWVMLVKSATYVDDGSPVFQSVADVMAAPATEANNIMAMTAEVSRLNLPSAVPAVASGANGANGANGADVPSP